MIIPVRCFSCGKPIAHLWETYIEKVQEGYKKPNYSLQTIYKISDSNKINTVEAKILDNLNINRYCCRRMFLTHVEMADKI